MSLRRPCSYCGGLMSWWRTLTFRELCFPCAVSELVTWPLPDDYFDRCDHCPHWPEAACHWCRELPPTEVTSD